MTVVSFIGDEALRAELNTTMHAVSSPTGAQ
jgi:hypothetical protein